MQDLFDKITDSQYEIVKRYLLKVTTQSLSALTEPCYYPESKKHYYNLLSYLELTEKDMMAFSKNYWKGRKEVDWNLQKDPITMFYVFLMIYSLQIRKDESFFSSICLFLGIRYYSNLMAKYIKYCNPEYFKYSLNAVFKTHLFTREESVSGAIIHLSNELQKRYITKIILNDKDGISKFITEYRTRLEQSIRKFAHVYYNASENNLKLKNPYEDDEENNSTNNQQLETTSLVAIDISKKICVYKSIDNKAFQDAKKLTKIGDKLASLIINELHSTLYIEDVKTTVELFLEGITNIKKICNVDFFKYLHGLIVSKKRDNSLSMKKQIIILVVKIMKKLNKFEMFDNFSSQTKLLTYLFLAYYISLSIRNSICYKIISSFKS